MDSNKKDSISTKKSGGFCRKFTPLFFIVFVSYVVYFVFVKKPRINSHDLLISPFLDVNDLPVSKVRKEFKDVKIFPLTGCESLLFDEKKDVFYSGTSDGYVKMVHIETGEITDLISPLEFGVKISELEYTDEVGQGPDTVPLEKKEEIVREFCNGHILREKYCGRVLGMRFDSQGNILICNSNKGIFRYSPTTQEIEMLTTGGKFYNDVLEAPDGKIYFTDSTKVYMRYQLITYLYDHPHDGTFNVYDPETKAVTVLKSGFIFSNGVTLSMDGKSIYMAECLSGKIWKYEIASASWTVALNNTYVYPDNISIDKETGRLIIAGIRRTRLLEPAFASKWFANLVTKLPIPIYAIGTLMLFPKDGVVLEYTPSNMGTWELEHVLLDETGELFTMTGSAHKHGDRYFIGSVVVQEKAVILK